MKIKVAL